LSAKELELELVELEKEVSNEEKMRILLHKAEIILNKIKDRKRSKSDN
jgi:hypothetical protein